MGYCMELSSSKFRIRQENVAHAFNALKQLALHEAPRRRGGYFAWTHTPVLQAARSLQEHMAEWRWPILMDTQGNVVGIDFHGEKLGDDKVLFDTLAPFVEKGSFLLMHGEDGSIWRWYFNGQVCKEEEPTVSFIEDTSDVVDVQAREVREYPQLPR